MPKLAIFLRDLDGGGAEKVMVTIAEGFAERGVSVDLVLVEKSGPYLESLSSRVNLIDLGSKRLLTSIRDFAQYLRQVQPDAVISALEDTNVAAILAARISGVKSRVVVTVHNHVSIESRQSRQLKRKLAPYLIRWLYPLADRVVTVSQGVATDIVGMGVPKDRVTTIYNPILTPSFRAQLQERANHPWLHVPGIPVILGVGRLHPQKNFALLIRAFHRVRQDRLAKLIILGEGPERQFLKSLIDDLGLVEDVQLPGFVNNPAAWIGAADLLVLSSDWEGFGNVLVEAMAAGTPVVSTRCDSGPAEILVNGRYGQLTPVGDVQSLSEAIKSTLDNPPEAASLRSRAEAFDRGYILDQYHHVCFD